jgi:hypothetical protein
MNIATQAESLAKHLTRHDVAFTRTNSAISSSVYFEIRSEDMVLRLRGSDHVARPTYEKLNGIADYEFGEHDMAQGDAVSAAVFVLRSLGIAADATLRAILSRRRKAGEAARAERERSAAAVDAIMATQAADHDAMVAWAGERWTEANDPRRSAKSRKRARQKLRAQWEASR